MKAIVRWGGGLAAVLLISSVSFAQTWVTPVTKMPYPPNPDACGPGYYVVNGCGAVYGPNYWIKPPYPPFNGILPGPTGQCLQAAQNGIPPWTMKPPPNPPQNPGRPQTGIYPTHPYIRSPRDFFMWSEDMQDTRGRDIRPNLVVP
jgi:hypothetical protein